MTSESKSELSRGQQPVPQPTRRRLLSNHTVGDEIASAGRPSVAAVALLVVLAACADDQPARAVDAGADANPIDAPDVGLDAPADPPLRLTRVQGRVHTTCHQIVADIDSPTDLSNSMIQVLVPDRSPGGYRVVNGHGDANGDFVIDEVPDEVTFTLRIDDDYYVTDQHIIDLRSETGVRCSPPPEEVSSRTPVTLQLTGMTPFSTATDRIRVHSLSVGYFSQAFPTDTLGGQTAIDTTFDWRNGFLPTLLDAALGDELVVLHQRLENVRDASTLRTHREFRMVDAFRTSDVTLRNGVPATITGAFDPVALNRSVSFSLDRSLFDAGYDDMSIPLGTQVTFSANALGGEFAETMTTLFFNDVSRSTSLVDTVTNYRFGDPFPASWNRFVQVFYSRRRFVGVPIPHTVGAFATLQSHTLQREADTGAVPTAPVLHPPGGAQVAGVHFTLGGKVLFDGRSPVHVTWNAVPLSTLYFLEIQRLDFENYVLPRTIARFVTTATSLQLPAALFHDGDFYVFLLNAGQAPARSSAGHLVPQGFTDVRAQLPSGRFRFSSHCGDGVVQIDEECDTSGQSATCNIDCTKAICGDGLRNATAGEACDSVFDAPGCNSDCTLPACGDRHVNKILEDCDDGNATDDGNGCDGSCKFNNICGNHIVESAAEACDDDGVDTAGCDADCSLPLCGDGHLNTAAGEECDDSNTDDTDHCSSLCKVQ
jgi:cysteine-rich repeat protein